MNGRQRRKLFAGAGAISMLLGALMVVAPTGAGASHEEGHVPGNPNLDCPEGTTEVAKFNWTGAEEGEGGSYVEEGEPGPVTIDADSDTSGGSWTSTVGIDAVIVKGADDAKIDLYEEARSGDFDNSTLLNDGGNVPDISNITFCADEPSLTVEKVVVGTPDEGATYAIDVDRDGSDLVTDELFGEDDPYSVDGSGTYDIEETANGGADSVAWACYEGGSTTASDSGSGAVIDPVVVVDDDVTCVFTNTFDAPAPETSLILRKQVSGSESWSIDLTCTTEVPDEEVVAAAVVSNSQRVTNLAPGFSCADAAGSYQIEEDLGDEEPGNMTFTSVSCSVPNGEGGLRTFTPEQVQGAQKWVVDVAEGTTVTCTFVNTVPSGGNPLPPQDLPQSLTVVKSNVGAVPSNWSVDFDIDGPTTDREFNLDNAAGTSASSTAFSVDEGSYVISEEVLGLSEELTSSLRGLTCTENGAAFSGFSRVGDTARLTIGDGDNVVCTFVNNYTAVAPNLVERASIVIDKAVQGPAPSEWSFGFAGTGGITDFELTNAAPSNAITVNEGTYTISEDASTTSELVAVNCGDAVVEVDLDARSVTFEIDGGETVSCTFRNRYPTPPTTVQQPTEVAGDVVTRRQLPRTGSDSTDLAGFGAALLLFGAGLVIISRAHRYSVTS